MATTSPGKGGGAAASHFWNGQDRFARYVEVTPATKQPQSRPAERAALNGQDVATVKLHLPSVTPQELKAMRSARAEPAAPQDEPTPPIQPQPAPTSVADAASSEHPPAAATRHLAPLAPAAEPQVTVVTPLAPESTRPEGTQPEPTPTERDGSGSVVPAVKVAGPAAARGWRGLWNRVLGRLVVLAPSAAERREAQRQRRDQRLQQARDYLAGCASGQPSTVVVANVKGGSGKTTTAALLSAVLTTTGDPVVAMEACEVKGTLADRTEGDASGISGLLRPRPEIRSRHQLASYLARQSSHALVLASPQPRPELTGEMVTLLHRLLQPYFSWTVTDTANNPLHPAWRAARDTADVVVVPCWATPDSLAGALDCMRECDGVPVVAVVIHPQPGDAAAVAQSLRAAGAVTVVEVPFDPAIAAGGPLRLQDLTATSVAAWTHAGAAAAHAALAGRASLSAAGTAQVIDETHTSETKERIA